ANAPGPGAAAARPVAPVPPQGRLTPADAATAAAAARAAAQGPGAQPAAGPRPVPNAVPNAVPNPAAAAGAPNPGPGPNPGARPMQAGTPAPAAAPAPAVRPAPGVPLARPAAPPPAFPPGHVFRPVRPPVAPASARRRHWGVLAAFLFIVVIPTAVWGWYLWNRAADQYASTVGFSVRKEDQAPSIDLLGGLTSLAGGSGTASDTDILYDFIRSPDLVTRIDETLDLRAMFSRAWPRDFVFAYDPSGTIEDLTSFWHRQVRIYYDDSSGIITVKASAFAPQDAQAVAQEIFDESERVVNSLSEKARTDATRLAEAELDKARRVLTEARQAMTAFRVRSRIIDPTADLGAQMTVMTSLQGQLAEAQVMLDQLRQNARPQDQRVIQGEKRVAALESQIEEERAKFGGDTPEGANYAQLVAEYEKLLVDQEFAEAAHQTARIAYEGALQAAQRQSRYLAAHIAPSAAERSLEPARWWLLAMGAALALAIWSIGTLVYYSVRDRR
ncbi:capsule biosynthesis protein, partial [Paracoccus luteus]|uniref:capsule biosynthesis protein n=1 Tax=Paracoccus luteus TaxID=2508543 RepID=UPI001FE78E1F